MIYRVKNISITMELVKIGTSYGGWHIPLQCDINSESIVYSAGVGEDISFDVLLSDKYDCKIHLVDPTSKSKKHFEECKEYYTTRTKFTGNIQPDYYSIIEQCKPNFNKIIYNDYGLWDKSDTLKFYKQNNEEYVSQSLIDNMFGEKYDIVNVLSLRELMLINGNNTIDMLKLDIEGAENVVLNQMLSDNIYPKYLCVEFDLLLKGKDIDNVTKTTIERLCNNGYKIIMNDNLNITFERTII